MTFPFFKSSLSYDESKLASLILDNFNLKKDLSESYYEYLKTMEISKETDIELTILSIAILCMHRPNFISDEEAGRIEQTYLEVIVWMTGMYPKYISTVKEGQLYFAQTKLDTYKKELLICLNGDRNQLPWNIYSSIFHFPLQRKIVEENEQVLERIQNFNYDLRIFISNYKEVAFKCFVELHPNPRYPI